MSCQVKDTGVGISENDLREIFEPFTQVDSSSTRSRSGSGLGLSICREIVEKMNGTISATSQLGVGSEFCFTTEFQVLPALKVAPDGGKLSHHSVLIVDDNQTNREIMLRVFSEWNVEATAVENGDIALEMLKSSTSNRHQFSLAIVDSHMPNKSGIALIEEIRAHDVRIPIVLMVSPSEKLSLARRSRELRIKSMLEKPVTRTDVFDSIMTVLKESVAELPAIDPPSSRTARPLKLLAAEDMTANQKVVRAILERRGHTVQIVGNGSEALAAVQSNQFDAILMDIQMPLMDGIQATRAIRSRGDRNSKIPIVAMTAHARGEDRKKCLAAGMSGYISKPLDAEKMVKLIENLVNRPTETQGALSEEFFIPIERDDPVNLPVALNRLGGDQEILSELITAFLEDAPRLMKKMRRSLKEKKRRSLYRAVHSLKGLAANFEALELVKVCQMVEDKVKSPPAKVSERRLDILNVELTRVVSRLELEKSDPRTQDAATRSRIEENIRT